MFRNKRIWLGLIAILMVGSGGFYFYNQNLDSVEAQVNEEAEVQTAVRQAIITALNGLPNAAELDAEQIADDWLSEN